jgi:hypothetical protein
MRVAAALLLSVGLSGTARAGDGPEARDQVQNASRQQVEEPRAVERAPAREVPPAAAPSREAVARPAAPPQTGAPLHPGRAKLIAGALVAAVGLALIAVGIDYVLEVNEADEQLLHVQPGQPAAQIASDRSTYQAWSIVGFAVGGAALATGAVVLGLGVRERRAARVTLSPRLGSGGGGAVLSGIF